MEVIGRAVLSSSEPDRQITAALMTLSQEWRRVVYYADVEGFSHKEIAEMMNTPVGTVVSGPSAPADRPLRGRHSTRFALDHTRDHALCLGASQ
jgi:Sigma-70, region 4